MVIIISMIEVLIKVTLLSTTVARKGNYFNKSMFSYVSLLAWYCNISNVFSGFFT